MKTKILFIGWEESEFTSFLKGGLKELAEKYEIILANFDTDALHEIAMANFQHNDPIRGLVFKRNALVCNAEKFRLIYQFTQKCAKRPVVAINFIWNDEDKEARDSAVSAFYARENDWAQVEVILKNNL